MKKILTILLIATMTFGLVACGSKDDEETKTPEEVKIEFVSDDITIDLSNGEVDLNQYVTVEGDADVTVELDEDAHILTASYHDGSGINSFEQEVNIIFPEYKKLSDLRMKDHVLRVSITNDIFYEFDNFDGTKFTNSHEDQSLEIIEDKGDGNYVLRINNNYWYEYKHKDIEVHIDDPTFFSGVVSTAFSTSPYDFFDRKAWFTYRGRHEPFPSVVSEEEIKWEFNNDGERVLYNEDDLLYYYVFDEETQNFVMTDEEIGVDKLVTITELKKVPVEDGGFRHYGKVKDEDKWILYANREELIMKNVK